MAALRRYTYSLYAKLLTIGYASYALPDRFRLGITSRLVIALIGVAALALASNFIVEHGVLVERTTEITHTSPVPIPPLEAAPIVERPAFAPAIPPNPPERQVITSEPLMLALARFAEAIHERVETKSERTQTIYQRSLAELNHAADTFVTMAAAISGMSFGKVKSAVKVHERHGAELLSASDSRRALISDYASRIEGLNTRSKNSLNGSWKIFGRVIARQSLVQLSADLDFFRRQATAFGSADIGDASELGGLLTAEQNIEKDLDANMAGLRRSEGDDWYNAVRSDFSALVATREAIAEANGHVGALSAQFSQESTALGQVIPGKIEGSRKADSPPAATQRPEARTSNAQIAPAPLSLFSSPAPAPDSVAIRSVKTQPIIDNRKRTEIAWISVAVLALSLYIAAGTVLSVVRPVRRLLDATSKLARGDGDVRVLRGGIKELDAVAVAFNTMAAELSAARASAQDYQKSLELKVTERTRQLQDLAEHDPLTGLPNRRQLFLLLNAAINRVPAEEEKVGVFFLDIDNFKYINDSMGHAFGDRVLIDLAQRLQKAVEPFGFAARLG
ncbi:MAG: diguanylate cyclase, partial [Pseudomonadota bacterium]|nr:diguanylate cyclase [Pseudomonadota bacterium]